MFTELFPELQMAKLRLDTETKRLLVGQLMIDTEMNKAGVLGFISQLITDESTHDSLDIEDYIKMDSEGLDKLFGVIGESMSFLTKMRPKGGVTICKGRFKNIIYGAMKAQEIFHEYSLKKSPTASKIWVRELGGKNPVIVSAYSWKMARRMFPAVQGAPFTSLVKLEMDRESIDSIDKLIRENPWTLILPHKGMTMTDIVLPRKLYVPEVWGTPWITIAEHLLKEEDIRILKQYAKESELNGVTIK